MLTNTILWFLVCEVSEAFKDKIDHEMHFILNLMDDGLSALEMRKIIVEGGFNVIGRILKFSNLFIDLFMGHEGFQMGTKSTMYPTEVDRWKEGFIFHVIGMMERLVSDLFKCGSWIGDDSFEEISMMFVLAVFLGGFLVEEDALETIFHGWMERTCWDQKGFLKLLLLSSAGTKVNAAELQLLEELLLETVGETREGHMNPTSAEKKAGQVEWDEGYVRLDNQSIERDSLIGIGFVLNSRTTSITQTAKLPILNPGDYNLWLMRIENEMKARGTLLMALPNKDQMKFHSYKDAKLLMDAIEKRYGENKESKKVQRTLLKQQYENFAGSSSETMDQTFDSTISNSSTNEVDNTAYGVSDAHTQSNLASRDNLSDAITKLLKQQYENFAGSSSETMDQTFDRLQKLISQLEIQGERNKEEIETISLDDLYKKLNIYEPKLTGSSSTSKNPQNVAFVSSNNNSGTNEADNTAYGVTAAHTQSNPTSGDNLSNAVICAFLASQPNSPQLAQEDLEQIDPDDLEEMDLQWEMAMLTIRARRFIKRTSRKLDVNGQRVGFDRFKVECYNCHKKGHFARECRAPRNQENRERENSRRTVTVETPTENALVAQDGIGGYDWSYQAEEEHPTNYALMAYTSSGSSSSSDSEVDSCSKSCVKAYATLKEQYDSLSSDYKKSQFNLVSYKAGLESVEARLAHYKKNEAVFEESINVLNLEVKLRDNALVENKKKLEKAEKERDELKLTLEKFQNSSKSLNNLLESQVIDNPVEPKTVRSNSFRPLVIEDWNSDDDSEVEFIPNVEDKTVRPSTEKIKFVNSARETVGKATLSRRSTRKKEVIGLLELL
ncbi:ribonuclease H-like domain-containing protein [Tanacetum coccineum]